MKKFIIIRNLNTQDFKKTINNMYNFIKSRTIYSLDEIWFVEHFSVFSLGRKEKIERNFLNSIPVVQCSRGGKITFHGLGQQIMYIMITLKNIKVKKIISLMEKTIISTLSYFKISSHIKHGFPGVYVKNKKIGFIGLNFYKKYSSYGLSLNVKMDMTPFSYIQPCGISNLKVTQVSDYISNISLEEVRKVLEKKFIHYFSYVKYE